MRTIFVSSTFADMQYERDILRDEVAPKLNDKAREYNEHIEFCDLRWGINTEEMESEEASRKVLGVCLDEIDRTNPPMIIIIGERYGWIPEEDYIHSVAERKNIKLDTLKKSVTALECEYGILSLNRKALVYFREIECVDETLAEVYRSENEECFILLNELKRVLKSRPNCTVSEYGVRFINNIPNKDDLHRFSDKVVDDIEHILLPDWKRFAQMTSFERERERQWTFIREKKAVFTARQEEANLIIDEILKGNRFTICKGSTGSGKSTLFSYVCLKVQESGWKVLPFIAGLTDESNDGMDILRNSVYYFEELLKTEHVPYVHTNEKLDDGRTLLQLMQGRLRELSYKVEETGEKILIAIDAIDQLFPDEIRETFAFIPDGLSENISFFMTSLPDIEFLQKKYYGLQSLMSDDIRKVIHGVMNRLGKELSERVIDRILEMETSDNPYYVSMIVQRLCMMGFKDFLVANKSNASPIIALTNRQIEILDNCPDSIKEMCVKLIKDAAGILNSRFLYYSMKLLATSRYGLRRSDLSSIVGKEWNELLFAHFLNYLYEDFQVRTDGRIDFMHKTIKSGIRDVIGNDQQFDIEIAEYMEGLDKYDPIRMNEYPYHLISAKKYDDFANYIKKYELGKNRDEKITRAAAKTVRDYCVENDWKWLDNVMANCYGKPYRNEIMWFVINELKDEFGNGHHDRVVRESLLSSAYHALESLCKKNCYDENTKTIYYEKLTRALISDCDILGETGKYEFRAEMGNVYLDIIKRKTSEKNDINSLIKLYEAYYMNLYSHKDTDKPEILYEAISIASEGEKIINIIENKLQERKQIYTGNGGFGPFYGCLGDVYSRLHDKDNFLRTVLKDLEYRKKTAEKTKNLYVRTLLTGGYLNVANAYEAYETTECYESAYQYYIEAIRNFESVLHDGADIEEVDSIMAMLPVRMYLGASKVYIQKQKGLGKVDKEVGNATLWGLKSYDYARLYLKKLREPRMMVLLENTSTHTSKMMITSDVLDKSLEFIDRWIQEDENEIAVESEDDKLKWFINLQTCNVASHLIIHSMIKSHYDIAVKCCDRGIGIADTFLQNKQFQLSKDVLCKINEDTMLYMLSCFHELKYEVAKILDHRIEDELRDFIEHEEKRYRIKGNPSLRLASLNLDLSRLYINKKETAHLALPPLLRAREIYIYLLSKNELDEKTIIGIRGNLDMVNELVNICNRLSPQKTNKGQSYEDKIMKIIKTASLSKVPIIASDVSETILHTAIMSYAKKLKTEDIVAIEVSGIINRGKRGVIYSKDALYSSEMNKDECIPYSEIESVHQVGDRLRFKLKSGDKREYDFGSYQEQVLQMVSRIIILD